MRGHGSNRAQDAASFATLAADLVPRLERGGEAALVVGQSMGGVVALALAERRPDLIAALVLIESTVRAQPRHDEPPFTDAWPLPFREERDVLRYFGGPKDYAQVWLENFERTPDGYRPILSRPNLLAYLTQLRDYDYTPAWRRLTCPAFVVGGGRSGVVAQNELRAMAASAKNARYACIARGGHDLHLDAPAAWRAELEAFLR